MINTQWAGIHRATGADFIVAGFGTELLRAKSPIPPFEY
jgi:hypothetical protein